jgi:hypothetical protein
MHTTRGLPAWEVCPRGRFARDYTSTRRAECGVRRAARESYKALLCDQWGIKPKSTMQTCIFCCARMHGLCNPIGSKRVCLLISKQRAPICAEDFAVAMIVCVFAAASERVYGAPAPAPYGGPPHSLHSPSPPTRTTHAGTVHAMRRKATSSRVITRLRRFRWRRSWLLTVSMYGPPVPARSPRAHESPEYFLSQRGLFVVGHIGTERCINSCVSIYIGGNQHLYPVQNRCTRY